MWCCSDLEAAVELEGEEDAAKSLRLKIKKVGGSPALSPPLQPPSQAKVALKRSKQKDLYAVLGVTSAASESEIKSAYRKAALRFHPDKQASKSEEEKKVAEANFKVNSWP